MLSSTVSSLISAAATTIIAVVVLCVAFWWWRRAAKARRRSQLRADLVELLQADWLATVHRIALAAVLSALRDADGSVSGYLAKLRSARSEVSARAQELGTQVMSSAAWQGLSGAGHPASKALLKMNQWEKLLAAAIPFESADDCFAVALGNFLAVNSAGRGGALAWCESVLLNDGIRSFLHSRALQALEGYDIDTVLREILGDGGTADLLGWLGSAAEGPILLPVADADFQNARRVAVLELPKDSPYLAAKARLALPNVPFKDTADERIRLAATRVGFSLRLVARGDHSLPDAFRQALVEAGAGRRNQPFISPQAERAVRESGVLEALGLVPPKESPPEDPTPSEVPPSGGGDCADDAERAAAEERLRGLVLKGATMGNGHSAGGLEYVI